MAVDANTLVILGGLAVLGAGAYFILGRQPQPSAPTAASTTSAVAQATGVTNAAVQMQMLQLMQQMESKILAGTDPKLAEAQLISSYVNLGIGSATQIANAIAGLLPKKTTMTESQARQMYEAQVAQGLAPREPWTTAKVRYGF